MFNKLKEKWKKKEYSKQFANVIITFTFIFFSVCLGAICYFPESAVQIVALAGVFVTIPVTTIGFLYNKAKKENEIKLSNVTTAIDNALAKATTIVDNNIV